MIIRGRTMSTLLFTIITGIIGWYFLKILTWIGRGILRMVFVNPIKGILGIKK